jgi:thiosulfate dehydrogenase
MNRLKKIAPSLWTVCLVAIATAACDARSPAPGPKGEQERVTGEAVEAATDEYPGPPGKEVDYQAELPASPRPGEEGYFIPPPRAEMPDGPFGDAVRRGALLFRKTDEYAAEFVGNGMQCANCHLNNGRRPNSAPMWAAWGRYPAYRRKNDHVNTMDERIRGCFTYSMNAQGSAKGHPPEPGHQILTDLQAYMFWLATGAPTGEKLAGRGYPKLKKPAGGWSVERGAKIYASSCALCHGDNGEGQKVDGRYAFPPLWGPDSFNWGAGMHRVNTAADFIKANMPLGQSGTLTDQQAWDVAAYINSHERPPDPRSNSSLAKTDETFHEHQCLYGEEADGEPLGTGTTAHN